MIAGISYLFVYFHRFSTAVLSEQIALDLTGDMNTDLSIFSTMYMWSYALMQPFIGAISDLIDPKYIIAMSNLLSACGTFVISISSNLTQACIGRFLVGLGCSGVFVATNKIGANWLSSDGFRFLAGALIGIGGVGSLLSQVIIFLARIFTWKICFQATSIIGLMMCILSLLFIKGKPRDYYYRKDKFSSEEREAISYPFSWHSLFSNFKIIFSLPDFWLISIYAFFLPGYFMSISSYWGTKYLWAIGLSESDAAFIQMSLSISIVVGSPMLPMIAKLLKSRKIVLFMCALTTIIPSCILMSNIVINKYWLMIIYFVLGFGSNSSQGIVLPIFKELVNTSNMEATILGAGNLSPFLGSAVIQILCSLVFNTFDFNNLNAYTFGVWLIGVCCSIVSAFTSVLIKDPYYDKINSNMI